MEWSREANTPPVYLQTPPARRVFVETIARLGAYDEA
jgi:hypothetical protein